MIKVIIRDGESGDRLLKRFSNHIKSRRLQNVFRAARYFKQKPTRIKTREIALSREKHRAVAKKKQFMS